MSKVGNAIRMLLLLKCRRRMKIEDLARELEVAHRQIRRYRDDLEQAGYAICSVSGPDGGYELLTPADHFPLAFSKEEFIAMELLEKEMETQLPQYRQECRSVMEKLACFKADSIRSYDKNADKGDCLRETSPADAFLVKRSAPVMDVEAERRKFDDFQQAVIARRKIRMAYTSNSSGKTLRTVHPYAIVDYEGALYLIAHCERRNRKMYFKLVRAGDYEILQDKFVRDPDFDLQEHVDKCFGIFQGREMDVAVKIRPPFLQSAKEKVLAEGQTVTDLPGEEAVLFEARTQGMAGIVGWILSMGPAAEVLNPPELKKAVEEKLKETLKQYK